MRIDPVSLHWNRIRGEEHVSEAAGRRIRVATVADVEVILRHRRCMFADMGDGSEAELDAMVSRARPFVEAAVREGSYRAWLIDVDGEVVAGGGVAIVPYQPTPVDPAARRAYVLNMYTDPAHRRQGMARRVLEAIIQWCREQGFKAILLHASDAGRPLYRQMGFEPTNEMRLSLSSERGAPGKELKPADGRERWEGRV